MPRFAANISLMYTEWPFAGRFAVAADDGFTAVESHSPGPRRRARHRRADLHPTVINNLRWAGWVGAESRPRGATRDGLGWFQRWRG